MPCIDTVQGFCFARRRMSRAQAFIAAFLLSMKIIQPKRQNRLQGFTAAFPCICSIPSHTIQQPHKPPIHRLRHAGGHTVKRCTSIDTRHHRRTGTLYRSAQPPYYNNVYKGAAVRTCYRSIPGGAADRKPCQPGGVLILPTPGGWSPGTGLSWHTSGIMFFPGTAARNHWRLAAASLFGLSPDS